MIKCWCSFLNIRTKEKKEIHYIFSASSWEPAKLESSKRMKKKMKKTFLILEKLSLFRENLSLAKHLRNVKNFKELSFSLCLFCQNDVVVFIIVMAKQKKVKHHMFTSVQIGLGKWGRCYYISTQPMIAFGQKRELSLFPSSLRR